MNGLRQFIESQNKEEFKKYGIFLSKNLALFDILENFEIDENQKETLIDIITKYDIKFSQGKKQYLILVYLLGEIKSFSLKIQSVILFNFFPIWNNNKFYIQCHSENNIMDTPGTFLALFYCQYADLDDIIIFVSLFLENSEKIFIDEYFINKPLLKKLCLAYPSNFIISYTSSNPYLPLTLPLACYFASKYDLESLTKIKNIVTISIDEFLAYCQTPAIDDDITNMLYDMIDDFSTVMVFSDIKKYKNNLSDDDKNYLKGCLKNKKNPIIKAYFL